MSEHLRIVRPKPETAADDSKMIVQLTVRELRELIAQGVNAVTTGQRPSQLLTPEALAQQLSVPVSWVYEQPRQGKIPVHRIGRYLRFDFVEVVEAQKKRTP
jgi:excisionase family DNA binding protein